MNDITVVIPAYKSTETIRQTIKSLEIQTDKNFAVQIVEDGYDPLQRMAIFEIINDSTLVIDDMLLQKNRGVGFARNTGLRMVKTPYVVFLDADDLLLPNAIANFREIIGKEEPDVIIGKTMREHPDGSFHVVGNGQVTWIHGRCYKKSFLDKYNIIFPKIRMSEDLTFNALCIEFAEKVFETPWPVHIQRWRDGSISRSSDSEILQAETYIGACIEYVLLSSHNALHDELKLLPQFVAMSYFYLDAIQYTAYGYGNTELYAKMCEKFCALADLIDLKRLVQTEWGDKLNQQLLVPVRPYNGPIIPPVLSFGDRWADAVKTVKEKKYDTKGMS